MKPYSPIPRFVRGEGHLGLIHRLLRQDIEPDIRRIDLITTTFLRLSLLDSGNTPTEQIAEGDTCIHILWQANESGASIDIGGERFAIAPGDFTWIPAGDSWQLSPDQLVLSIVESRGHLALPIEPTHGEDRFIGHNRESRVPGRQVSRWKLTESLTLPESDSELIFVSLYGDIAIQVDGSVTMLRQGETSVIRPGTGRTTLVPNGLSYVLVLN